MRIRSIKPQFWRSADTAELDMFTRLLFIGLWNYVDDNGVGDDDVNLIRSDLFPRDQNIEELSRKIHGGLTELSVRAQITRFTDLKTGRKYFSVTNWHHQKINRPTASNKPLPTSENVVLTESSVNPHGGLTEDSLLDLGIKGSRDQGIKGTPHAPARENSRPEPSTNGQGKALAEFRETNKTARSPAAYRIAEAFSASLSVPIEAGLLARIGVHIDNSLKANIPAPVIAEGLKDWTESDSWSDTQIPAFIHKAGNRRGISTTGKPTAKAVNYDAAAAELLKEIQTP
jgi:hypothetical protein